MSAPKEAGQTAEPLARFRVKGRRCPICRKPATIEHRPFCSKRCAQIDLGRWLGEVYRTSDDSDDDAISDGEVWSEQDRR